MKRRVLILFLSLLPLSPMAKDISVTIYVDDAYKPFSYEENGRVKGMYIDILRHAFTKLKGFNVTMKPIPWSRGKVLMERGQGFALFPPYFHGHDWPYLYPYSLPIYTETVIIVCNEYVLNKPRPNWPDDYIGLSIGTVAGFDGWVGKKLKALIEAKKVKYYETQNAESLINMVLKGRQDCIISEDRAFDYEINRMKQIGGAKGSDTKLVKSAVVSIEPAYIGYSERFIKKQEHDYTYEFRKALDVIIYQMKKSGEIDRIMDAYEE